MKTDVDGVAKTSVVIDGTKTHARATHVVAGITADYDWQIYVPTPAGNWVGIETGNQDSDDGVLGIAVLPAKSDGNATIIGHFYNDGDPVVNEEMWCCAQDTWEPISKTTTDADGKFQFNITASGSNPTAWIVVPHYRVPENIAWQRGLAKVLTYKDIALVIPYGGVHQYQIQDKVSCILARVDEIQQSTATWSLWPAIGTITKDNGYETILANVEWELQCSNPNMTGYVYCSGQEQVFNDYFKTTTGKHSWLFQLSKIGLLNLRVNFKSLTAGTSASGNVTLTCTLTVDGRVYTFTDTVQVVSQ